MSVSHYANAWVKSPVTEVVTRGCNIFVPTPQCPCPTLRRKPLKVHDSVVPEPHGTPDAGYHAGRSFLNGRAFHSNLRLQSQEGDSDATSPARYRHRSPARVFDSLHRPVER